MGNCTSILQKAENVNNRDIQAQGTFSKTMVEYQDSTVVVEAKATNNATAFNTKRKFHNDESSTYWLPMDDDEQKRLTGVQTDTLCRKIANYPE